MGKLNWTNEQKAQYYQENINLIHSAVKQFKSQQKTTLDYDDIFQMAVIGMLKGFDQYDDSRNVSLSTYLTTCMKNEVKYQTRPSRSKSRTAIVLSYEGHIMGNDGKDVPGSDNLDLSKIDSLHQEPISMEDLVEQKEQVDIIHDVMNRFLSETERKLMLMHADGRTQNYIADKLGLSQANVSKLIRQTRCRILLHLRRSGHAM